MLGIVIIIDKDLSSKEKLELEIEQLIAEKKEVTLRLEVAKALHFSKEFIVVGEDLVNKVNLKIDHLQSTYTSLFSKNE